MTEAEAEPKPNRASDTDNTNNTDDANNTENTDNATLQKRINAISVKFRIMYAHILPSNALIAGIIIIILQI